MKSFLRFIGIVIPAQCVIAALFIYINNIPQIPWEIIDVLWYFFLPVSAFSIGLIYGICRLRRGGGVFLAALFLSPLPVLSFRFPLPFSDVFTFLPVLFLAVILGLIGEIRGRTLPHRQKTVPQES
ncbi:MAG: hypothetical protein ACI3W6_07050 [Clostridia bacterium]